MVGSAGAVSNSAVSSLLQSSLCASTARSALCNCSAASCKSQAHCRRHAPFPCMSILMMPLEHVHATARKTCQNWWLFFEVRMCIIQGGLHAICLAA